MLTSAPTRSTPATPAPDDWSALLAWRDGDDRAAALLANRYLGLLMRFFLNKVRNIDDAGELVSETFLGCTVSRDRSECRGSFRSFLMAVAMNKLRGYYRRQAKRRRELDDFADLCVAQSLPHSPSTIIARAQEARLLVSALRQLTLAQQIVLELSYFEELRGPQIAQLLGVPISTVHTHLSRGRRRLAQIVQQITADPVLAQSTLMGLQTWAACVRAKIPRS